MKKLLLCFALGVFLFSCTKDDSPTDPVEPVDPVVTFFTFTLDKETLEEIEGAPYVLLNDKEGNLLGYEKLTEAKKYEFKANKSKLNGSLLFTLISIDSEEGEFYSIANIPFYTDWTFSPEKEKENIENKFNLKIDGDTEKLSKKVYPFMDLDYNSTIRYGYDDGAGTEYTVTKSNKYFVTTTGSNKYPRKYCFVEGIKDGETRNLSYDRDFKNYEASIDVVNRGKHNQNNRVYGRVKLIENSKSVITSDIYPYEGDLFQLLFPLKDANYEIRFLVFDNKGKVYNYESRGLMPTESMNLPKHNFKVTDDTFFNLKFSTDIANYNFRTSFWEWSNDNFDLYWTLYTNNKEVFKQPTLPEEITDKYLKNFKMSELKHNYSVLDRGLEYKDYIYNKMRMHSSNEDYIKKENYTTEWFRNQ